MPTTFSSPLNFGDLQVPTPKYAKFYADSKKVGPEIQRLAGFELYYLFNV